MSGAELALGIVPLVIVLVEHHRTIIRKSRALTLSKISNYQQLDFYEELHAEMSLLHVTLDRIKAVSIRAGSNAAGYEESLDMSIAKALGDNAPHFRQILSRVMKSIDDLVREKSSALTDDETEDQFAMLQRLEQFRKTLENGGASKSIREKFRFTRNEKTRNVAMKRIQVGISRLERILAPSTDIFDAQSRESRRKTPVTRTRRLSEELYNKMAIKWPRACPCHHVARLCLWNCCCAHDDRDASDESLDLVVSMSNGARSVPKWQESTIHIMESSYGQGVDSTHSKKGVHFPDDSVPAVTLPGLPGRDIDSYSLCTMLLEAQKRNSSLQVMLKNGKLWQKRSKEPCLHIGDQVDVSLESLLSNSQKLRLREKSILAVVLAHAVLHCSEGPWLRADWSKEHVSFFRKDATQQPDLSRPFLTMEFTQQPGKEHEPDLFMIHSNPALVSLGVLLLEINNGFRIEDCWCPEDLTDGSTPNDSTNLTAAMRLLENSEADLFIGYRNAVKACLSWDNMNGGREDEDFAKRMYEYIVEPLERELEHGFDMKPEDLGL